mgnify:CR=1 FL=1
MNETKTIDVLDVKGKKAGSAELPGDVFDVNTNIPLIHQVVVAQLAAARQGTHATKTRGAVSGGGKKPWRQKGTGRARQGSIRAPQWTGGGIASTTADLSRWGKLLYEGRAFDAAREAREAGFQHVNLDMIGYIMMAAGAVVLLLGLVFLFRRRSTEQVTRTVDPAVGERVTRTESRTSGDATV